MIKTQEETMDLKQLQTIQPLETDEAERCDDGFRIDDEIFMRLIALLICRGVFCRGFSVRDLSSRIFNADNFKAFFKNKFTNE
ncbi:unnamed protein product [Brachionus calyciflorus]|uniref:Uncharacterized protein n=1 Tax=Brachionus calyciflorus TaxID=104777 RepID=A0A814JS24_9BILA|nr:unnamed protein product [Brachionus calyciflorus]